MVEILRTMTRTASATNREHQTYPSTLALKQRPGGTRKQPIYYGGFFLQDISMMREMLKMNFSPPYRSDKATLLTLQLSVNHQIGLLYSWICEGASRSNSCVLIVSSGVQDGPILLTYHFLHFLHFPCDHFNKFFIDQACSRWLPGLILFCIFIDLDFEHDPQLLSLVTKGNYSQNQKKFLAVPFSTY